MAITINDLLQTIRHRLNRSMVQKPNTEQLNAVIDRFVNGGRILEDSELDAFLNPPLLLEATDSAEASVVVEAVEEAISTDEIIVPSPEVEAAMQAIVDDSQAMGLYEMQGNPLDRSVATPLTMDELVAVAELQKELGVTNEEVQAEIDSGDLIPVAGSDIDFVTPAELPAGDSEDSETVVENDSAVAEVTESPENTISEGAANVEPTEPN